MPHYAIRGLLSEGCAVIKIVLIKMMEADQMTTKRGRRKDFFNPWAHFRAVRSSSGFSRGGMWHSRSGSAGTSLPQPNACGQLCLPSVQIECDFCQVMKAVSSTIGSAAAPVKPREKVFHEA